MEPLEQILIELDSNVGSKVSRFILGLGILPAYRALDSNGGSWGFVVFFLAVLVTLRVGPAILRRLLPFSSRAKAIWAERRQTAKQFDSYQWQKLFWIGLGLLPYALVGRGLNAAEVVVAAVCLVGGAAGLLSWQRSQVPLAAH
jgi:hypothetical protein